jgi:osmotically-inducible protein OsmY
MRIKKTLLTGFLTVTILLLFNTTSVFAQNSITDQDITNAVNSELMLNSTTPSYLIDVKTSEGIVTLDGSVNHILAKDRAVKIARTVKGVRAVVNNIEVDVPDRSNEKLKQEIENALLNDPATDSYEVSVTAVNGYVTLDGTVESWQEKQLSEYVAKGVKGVKKVVNDIEIEYPEERADFDIQEDIEQNLEYDVRIDDGLIDVSVENGNVTLSGTVGSANEHYLAVTDAWVMGVNSVDAENLDVEKWARNENMRKNKYVEKTDKEVEEAVQDALLYDPRVYSFRPTVTVNNGIVTLTGKVDNLKAKRAAEEDAKNVVGVFGVNNHLRVRPAFVPNDADLEADVKQAIDKDPVLERWEIDVTADNGVVYLNGSVDSYFEKLEAKDVASKTKGVLAVENNLAVLDQDDYNNYNYYGWNTLYPPVQVDVDRDYFETDEEIESSINDQLWWSPYVNQEDVTVEVTGGTAVLDGTVETRREKVYAEINAMEGGANDVVNNISVTYGQ